jgi:hypothetical protein
MSAYFPNWKSMASPDPISLGKVGRTHVDTRTRILNSFRSYFYFRG